MERRRLKIETFSQNMIKTNTRISWPNYYKGNPQDRRYVKSETKIKNQKGLGLLRDKSYLAFLSSLVSYYVLEFFFIKYAWLIPRSTLDMP